LPEIVVNLDTQTGKVTAGGTLETTQIDAYRIKVLDALRDETLAETDIKERVGGNTTLTGKALRALCTDRAVTRTGEGVKGNPYLYAKSGKSSILDFPLKANPENETDDDLIDAVNF
jgi:hypothetical protein